MRSDIICLFVVAIACYAEGLQVPQEGEVTSHIVSRERGRRVESRKQVTALVGERTARGLKGKNAIDRGARAQIQVQRRFICLVRIAVWVY